MAEKMNKTLNECMMSMSIHAGLPKTFWVNAVNTIIYLINKGILVPWNCRIPEEVWGDRKRNFFFFF